MDRKALAPTFLDAWTADLGSPRMNAFFQRCSAMIPWDDLAAGVAGVFVDAPAGGRPHYPLVQLLKITFVQKWTGLSDPMAEEMLQDRLSFRRFVGLSLADVTPDETTIGNFRRTLLAKDLIAPLCVRRISHVDPLFGVAQANDFALRAIDGNPHGPSRGKVFDGRGLGRAWNSRKPRRAFETIRGCPLVSDQGLCGGSILHQDELPIVCRVQTGAF
jgi:hypothetical protein